MLKSWFSKPSARHSQIEFNSNLNSKKTTMKKKSVSKYYTIIHSSFSQLFEKININKQLPMNTNTFSSKKISCTWNWQVFDRVWIFRIAIPIEIDNVDRQFFANIDKHSSFATTPQLVVCLINGAISRNMIKRNVHFMNHCVRYKNKDKLNPKLQNMYQKRITLNLSINQVHTEAQPNGQPRWLTLDHTLVAHIIVDECPSTRAQNTNKE